jgi:hypothetical protein
MNYCMIRNCWHRCVKRQRNFAARTTIPSHAPYCRLYPAAGKKRLRWRCLTPHRQWVDLAGRFAARNVRLVLIQANRRLSVPPFAGGVLGRRHGRSRRPAVAAARYGKLQGTFLRLDRHCGLCSQALFSFITSRPTVPGCVNNPLLALIVPSSAMTPVTVPLPDSAAPGISPRPVDFLTERNYAGRIGSG